MTHVDSNYYSNARREIEPFLAFPLESILEVGCGEGGTLLWLQESKGVKICHGLEILPEVSERAKKKGLQVVTGNIETDGIPFQEKHDVVLCLDVLEHLYDPWRVLPIIVENIHPGGSLIVSLPNIAHFSVWTNLILKNNWRYESAGIMDRTHLRFFTHRTASELLLGAGLQLIQRKPKFARKTHRNINFLTLGLFERFLAYQYLFLAKKR